MELVSIIIPIYKVEKYLDKCIQSIVSQTYKNLEIILVDDGSPDSCPAMCDEWAKRDTRIRVIHKPNGGLSSARNAGIDIATGKYITFVDSDDFVDERMIEELLKLLLEHDADFSMCGTSRVWQNTTQYFDLDEGIKIFEGQQIWDCFFVNQYNNIIAAWAKLYKKDIFNNIRYPEGKLHEDLFVIHQILLKTKRFVHTSAALYNYVQRKGSITNECKPQNYLDIFESLKTIEADLQNYPEILSENYYHFMCNNLRMVYINLPKAYDDVLNIVRNKFLNAALQLSHTNKKNQLFLHCPKLYKLLANFKRKLFKTSKKLIPFK